MVFHCDYHMIFCHNNDCTSLRVLGELDTFQDFYLDLHKQLATNRRDKKNKNIHFPFNNFDTYLFSHRINHSYIDILFMSIIN